jgi:hypothetical protein
MCITFNLICRHCKREYFISFDPSLDGPFPFRNFYRNCDHIQPEIFYHLFLNIIDWVKDSDLTQICNPIPAGFPSGHSQLVLLMDIFPNIS